jgi:uncharacterized membrane protein YjjP (DUF1212 family)
VHSRGLLMQEVVAKDIKLDSLHKALDQIAKQQQAHP